MAAFGVTDTKSAIQHTRDRPFNDRRYAVDGKKLRQLGWKPRVSFEEGSASCIGWYGKYSGWWGDIENILSAFPVVDKEDSSLDKADEDKESKSSEYSRQAHVGVAETGPVSNGNGKLYDPIASNGVKNTNGIAKKRKAVVLEDE